MLLDGDLAGETNVMGNIQGANVLSRLPTVRKSPRFSKQALAVIYLALGDIEIPRMCLRDPNNPRYCTQRDWLATTGLTWESMRSLLIAMKEKPMATDPRSGIVNKAHFFQPKYHEFA